MLPGCLISSHCGQANFIFIEICIKKLFTKNCPNRENNPGKFPRKRSDLGLKCLDLGKRNLMQKF